MLLTVVAIGSYHEAGAGKVEIDVVSYFVLIVSHSQRCLMVGYMVLGVRGKEAPRPSVGKGFRDARLK